MDEAAEIGYQYLIPAEIGYQYFIPVKSKYAAKVRERQEEYAVREVLWRAWAAGYYVDHIETETTMVGYDLKPAPPGLAIHWQIRKTALAKKRPTNGEG